MKPTAIPPTAFFVAEALGVGVIPTEERDGVIWPVVSPALVRDVGRALKTQRARALATRSVHDIVATLDRIAQKWLDPSYPLRCQAIEQISAYSGFSEAMVAHAIELEQISSRAPDMLLALTRELQDPDALDGFVPSAKGRSTAVGPALIGGIFSANIPALPHLTVMRAFLVKAACLGRVSQGEPLYLPLYAQSIAQEDPALAACLAVLHWPHQDRACEGAMMAEVDHLIAYGGATALQSLRRRWPDLPATWHGHRMGFAFVGRSALRTSADAEAIAHAVAYDFSLFDQHACLAPQACYVERGGAIGPDEFASRLCHHMRVWAERLPPRRLTVEAAAGLRRAIEAIDTAELLGLSDARVISDMQTLQGAVVMAPLETLRPGPLDRFARVVPVENATELLEALRPVAAYLQCAALAGADDTLRLNLARLGVTRLCSPGTMGTPSMVWQHDGRPRLGELVRWCDEETVPPGT